MASKILADEERKIDSISNVLEDIGVLKFTSEDNVQWIGLEGSKLAKEIQCDLKQYLASMVAKEKQLDELISATCKKIFSFWSMILTIYLINYISVFQITNCKKT